MEVSPETIFNHHLTQQFHSRVNLTADVKIINCMDSIWSYQTLPIPLLGLLPGGLMSYQEQMSITDQEKVSQEGLDSDFHTTGRGFG